MQPLAARCLWLAAVALVAGCRARMAPPPPRGWAAAGPSAPAEDPHRENVRRLSGGDFATRAAASEALVAAGEDALPALGEAGDAPVPVHGGRATASATRPVLEAILGAAKQERLEALLASPWVSVRRVAAEELGRREALSALPALIERLNDADPGVRQAAGRALRRVTERKTFVEEPPTPADGVEVAWKWRTWWLLEQRVNPGLVRPR